LLKESHLRGPLHAARFLNGEYVAVAIRHLRVPIHAARFLNGDDKYVAVASK